MKVLVFGASAGLGRHIAEALARNQHDLLLIASDDRDLNATARDLCLRFSVKAESCVCRVGVDKDWLASLTDRVREFGELDVLMFPIGAASESDLGLLGLDEAGMIVEVNFLSVVATISCILPDMLRRQTGVVAGFGSVASARGRGRNVIYSAAKRALESYFESLRHLTAGSGIRTQYYHLGYLDTQQTYGRRLPFPAADPARVARKIVDGLAEGEGVFYVPGYWRWIVFALRLIPWFLYRRLSF